MIGILEHIDGRKLTIKGKFSDLEGNTTVYLRKGWDASTLLHLLQSEVIVTTVEEKGFQMVEDIKSKAVEELSAPIPAIQGRPSLPKTAVEKTKPVDMPSSANVPKLNFGRAESFTGVVGGGTETAKQLGTPRTQKDTDIMRQWAMGATLNSPALAQANDALALSTQQTIERAKRVAEELLKWVVER